MNAAAGEQCDDGGQSATCDADCTPASCGDGTLNTAAGEQCDDHNTVSGDGCSASCQTEAWTWTQVTASGPPPRGFHAMAYDAGRGVTVLYGGWNDSVRLGDTWEFK